LIGTTCVPTIFFWLLVSFIGTFPSLLGFIIEKIANLSEILGLRVLESQMSQIFVLTDGTAERDANNDSRVGCEMSGAIS
jgi:hypothetical protein